MSEHATIFVFPPSPHVEPTWDAFRNGWRAVILSASSGVLWEDEQNGGPRDASETGFRPPFRPGLWIWEGEIHHPVSVLCGLVDDTVPEFIGTWRRPTSSELADLACEDLPYVEPRCVFDAVARH